MTRFCTGAFLAVVVGIVVGACGDDSSGGYVYSGVDCSQYSNCGSCTPVPGCGWCYSGGGSCQSDPGYCAGGMASWTWDPTGCRTVLADASVNPQNDAGAGTDASTEGGDASDAPATDASGDGATDAAASDDGSSASDAAGGGADAASDAAAD